MAGVRRALLLGMSLLLALLVAACDEVNAPSEGAFEPSKPGVLTVATDRLPQPGFWNGEPEPDGGFEWALAEELAGRFGLDEVEVVVRPFEQLVQGDLGGADLAMSQITPTSERDEVLDFSEPYLSANPAVLVAEDFEVRDVKEARELTWAVQRGTTLEEDLERRIVPDDQVLHLDSQSEVVEAVREGEVDAALLDLPVALAYARHSEGELMVAAQLASDEALAIALPEGSGNREAVDSAIRFLINEGRLSELAERWLGSPLRGGDFSIEDVRVIRTK
jgi:polar amino acid transport system substrate-binding protein